MPTENHVLGAWSSTGFGSALLFWDLNLTKLAEAFFKEFGTPLWGVIKTAFYEGGFLFSAVVRALWVQSPGMLCPLVEDNISLEKDEFGFVSREYG
ncbi:hypothetical protein [Erwinia sp. HR93]|uniref:hypothetical protein n=1 Tax=Erwinia sp. HR93 TaxID=3094840 RepID=UPI002ADEE3E3|nr:hypothetical protein [Erwinia sp. HR93]MEA1062921.1 hypothetical protein [Erwinia sp. HR93]